MTGAAARAFLFFLAAVGATARPGARADERVEVAAAVDGATLTLADGRTLRLAGIEVAEPQGGRRAFADAARDLVDSLTRGRPLTLVEAAPLPDRHGRIVAHAEVDGVWVEGALLSAGLARVHPDPLNRARAAAMLAREGEARNGRRGVWASRLWAIVDAGDVETLKRDVGRRTIVEGRVHRADVRDGTAWIDLGDDWRTATAIKIGAAALRLFKKERVEPPLQPGTALRVRGVVSSGSGPVIEVRLPEQIERP